MIRAPLAICALASISILADYLLKRGSTAGIVAGCIIYGATGIGWSWIMQSVRLAELSVYYSVSMTLLLVLLGLAFGERPTLRDGAGIALGLGAVLILQRFT